MRRAIWLMAVATTVVAMVNWRAGNPLAAVPKERPELRLGGGTYRWAYEFYRSCATVMSPSYLEAIRTPILMGSAGQDTFVDSMAHREACARLPACRLVQYPESRHELLMETDAVRTPWLSEIERFVAAH